MTYEGEAPRWASDEFRKAHAICREAASKPQVVMPAVSGVKLSPNQCEA